MHMIPSTREPELERSVSNSVTSIDPYLLHPTRMGFVGDFSVLQDL